MPAKKVNPYVLALRGAASIVDAALDRNNHSGIVPTNPVKQSVGNRATVNVQAEIETPDGLLNIHLVNWLPSRTGNPGYDGEVVTVEKDRASELLQLYREGDFTDPRSEAGACLIYCVEQIFTGFGTSGETAIKGGMADAILSATKMKIKSMRFERKGKTEFFVDVNQTEAHGAIASANSVWKAIDALPPKAKGRSKNRKRAIKF